MGTMSADVALKMAPGLVTAAAIAAAPCITATNGEGIEAVQAKDCGSALRGHS